MPAKPITLDLISVASPCSVPWASMQGDDRVRHCSQCQLHVYNLSEMTREDANAFVENREGRTCIRFFRRTDGTLLTNDCPLGVRLVRRQLARALAGAAALIGFLLVAPLGAWSRKEPASCPPPSGLHSPLQRIAEWIDPWSSQVMPMGDWCPTPAPTPNVPVPAQIRGSNGE